MARQLTTSRGRLARHRLWQHVPPASKPTTWSLRSCQTPGFSLVELLVSSVIFLMMAAGTLVLLAITNEQTTQSQMAQEQQYAISIDLSRIQSINDRYTCASGSCSLDNLGAPPTKDEYYPSSSSAQTSFQTLCVNGNLVDDLISLINAEPLTSQMQSLGISRSVSKDTVTSPASHRYTVTWSISGHRIRQLTLVPTTAGWCP